MTNNEKIKTFFATAKKVCNETLLPCGRKAAKFANVQARKVAEITEKTATKVAVKVKSYAVEETGKLCDYLAENEPPAETLERLKGECGSQSSIEVDYTILEEPGEPAEAVFTKVMHLWKCLFGDNFFIFRRVKRRIRKNKKVSKRNIIALDEDELLEALKLALKVENTGFILEAFEIRGIPERFVEKAMRSRNLAIVKAIVSSYPEQSAPWVLCFLAEAREFNLCQKLTESLGALGEEYRPFVKVLIRRTDVNDCENWRLLDWLLKERKLEYYTLKVLFLEAAKTKYWLNFKDWRASRRSSTFLFIWFVV